MVRYSVTKFRVQKAFEGGLTKKCRFLLMVVGFVGFVFSFGASMVLANEPHASLVEVKGPITPATARFIERAIRESSERGAHVLVVKLDTPGGLIDSTRGVVESVLSSPIPVIVYVSPQGSRAASAGTFIVAAAHVAVMSPVSSIGAASPVGPVGDLPSTMETKAKEDVAAEIRSIAQVRGRNVQALEATVMEAKAYSASEALEQNIVDVVAVDLSDLLSKLEERIVCVGANCTSSNGNFDKGTLVTLRTEGLEVVRIEKTLLEKLLGFLADPTVAFIFLALGGLGVFLEWFLGVGLILPGLTGILCLALAFVGMGQLPVNWVGIVLLGLSLVLFYIDLGGAGTQVFSVVGLVSFSLGGLLLFGDFALPGFTQEPIDAPNFRVNPWLVLSSTAGVAVVVVLITRSILAARVSGTTGPTTIVSLEGEEGVVIVDLVPMGVVKVAGEEWTAVSDSEEHISKGDRIIVSDLDGITLKVFKSPLTDG